MIQLYNSCRSVRPNLKLLNSCQKCRPRQITVKLSDKPGKSNNNESPPDNKKEEGNAVDPKKSSEKKEYPEEPTTCCMSGCANCVWLDYAEKLSEYYRDGGEQAVKEINEKVSDPNIKAFLLHELRMRNKKF